MEKKEFVDFELMFETYEKIKQLLRKNATEPENQIAKEELERIGLDSECLTRLKVNNYLLDYINLFEKLEINKLDYDKIEYIINKLFIGQDGNKIGEINYQDSENSFLRPKRVNITDFSEPNKKRNILHQIRNCFAHGHYYIDINEEDTFVVFSKSDKYFH